MRDRAIIELLFSGGLRVSELVDLNQVAGAAVERVRARAREQGADLRFEGARRPIVVAADPEHLARILDALLANALAYAGERPWVRVRVRPQTEGRARVEVEDRGRGIPPVAAERIFERFYRVDDEAAAGQAGTGLGLYIGRELALRMGARLLLERSEPGAGSLFVLSIPELEPVPDD